MLIDDLFTEVLINPAKSGATKLRIVTGYSSSAMAFHHRVKLDEIKPSIQVELLIGMCPFDGLTESNHEIFQELMNDEADNFQCSYIKNTPPVHSKIYLWSDEEQLISAYIGSPNYTQTAFYRNREVVDSLDPTAALEYYENLQGDSIYCTHQDANDIITIYKDKNYWRAHTDEEQETSLEKVTVDFLTRTGEVGERSGLNWGQRPEVGREPNQAYIPLQSDVYSSDFFPPIRQHFTVKTDDGKTIVCTRAQQNGKAIHTPHNNSLIGEYFRNRLGVASGKPVTRYDLENYGRHTVDFYKIDEEFYRMDFST